MKKRTLPGIFSALLLALSTPLSASAYLYHYSNVDLDNPNVQWSGYAELDGTIVWETTTSHCGFLMVTDGTEPDTAALEQLPGFTSCSAVDEFEAENYQHFLGLEDTDTSLYLVTLDSLEDIVNRSRTFASEQSWVKDLYLFQYHSYCDCIVSTKSLVVTSEDPELLQTIPELSSVHQKENGSFVIQFTDELLGEIPEGDATSWDYSYYAHLEELAKQLQETYGESLITSFEADRWSMDFNSTETPVGTSIWEGFGDPNQDGDIDASDASDILIYAAQSGAGNTEASISAAAADINLDGSVDATDASLILSYAAANGAGQTVSLCDMVR